jgi:hypothetical protein
VSASASDCVRLSAPEFKVAKIAVVFVDRQKRQKEFRKSRAKC